MGYDYEFRFFKVLGIYIVEWYGFLVRMRKREVIYVGWGV